MGMLLPTMLPDVDRLVLIACGEAAKTAWRDRQRAQIILNAVDYSARATAARAGCALSTVVKWVTRYRAKGLEGLKDAARSGAPRH